MHHVSIGRDAAQEAVRNVTVKSGGLLTFDKSILRTCNDNDRHLQLPVAFPESAGRGDHESRFRGTGPNLRWTDSHLLWKSLELLRNWPGSKNFPKKKRPHQPAQDRRYSPIRTSAGPISPVCASGVQTVLRGLSLWPNPGRSKAITRYFLQRDRSNRSIESPESYFRCHGAGQAVVPIPAQRNGAEPPRL
jgi:hypothetical protein